MNTVSRVVVTGLVSAGALLTLVVPAAAHPSGYGGMGGGYGGTSAAMGGTFGGSGLGSLLVIVAIVIAAVLAIGYLRSGSTPKGTGKHSSSGQADALATLRERYARGDLSDDEFERRRETLSR
ncbi:SHOCT domain-containing protein [Halapricum hydrolyticum]|uniref:SHOCT domain-containing protein n=1 Tax=Halapricum hydrolyticum TaxID=2979991 RepID=A0AAE3LIY3_9EURY|nr:SHOCT domain-containing protein [Halapricum hydrolyticum]MCU4719420.1 SHOCT domain-containing protein [Halapricum hydrolyticum]MCU4728429.1 SHOCT domain-containing protein [Halapricum hydrolyticum]